MRRVAIIDYGLCNIDSIRRGVEVCGGRPIVARDPDVLADADLLILPGVGSFDAAMTHLTDWGLAEAMRARVAAGTPLLGICLGMQLLAGCSEEGGPVDGLGLLPGEVVQLKRAVPGERVPHMGWNAVDYQRDDPIFAQISSGTDFYFVHSFHMRCTDERDVVATTPFCGGFVSAVRRDAVWGTQFHPEKSCPAGHQLLTNFISSS